MTPAPLSSKQGWQQVDEIHSGLLAHGIDMDYVEYIVVEVDILNNWPNDTVSNVNFLNSIFARLEVCILYG